MIYLVALTFYADACLMFGAFLDAFYGKNNINNINIAKLLSEYIDYHLSSESSITKSQTYPQILSRLDINGDPLNVTAQVASTITLHCVIRNLNNKTVRKPLN